MKARLLTFLLQPKCIVWVYLIVGVISALLKYSKGPSAYNNYVIFKNVFYHTIAQKNLYLFYSELYLDHNLYGVIFSILVAPFALLPDVLGMPLWNLCNALVFVLAVLQLPFSDTKKAVLLWLCLQEFITSSVSLQFNVALTGLMIYSAVGVYQRKESQVAVSILLGFFVKIYGIAALSSFFFIKNKTKFILWFVGVSIAFFALPMLLSSPHFVVQSYADWFYTITEKNNMNQALGNRQDYSIMGIFRRVLGREDLSNRLFLLPGIVIFALPYTRIRQYKNLAFQLMILVSTLLFVVLFSSSSESSTYIIAVSGVMIWFVMQKNKSKWDWFLMIFVLILTSFGFSDLFPKYIKENYIMKYSLKALPCCLVWFRVIYELMTQDFVENKNYTLS